LLVEEFNRDFLKIFFFNFIIFFFIKSLYDSIKTEPFKIPEDDGNDLMHTFFNPDKEGWLWKQGIIVILDYVIFYTFVKS